MDLAQACLIAGLNVTKNCQLLAIRKMQHLSPSIYLDDMLIAENNKLNEKFGLKQLM